ncbi:hypothetical protein THAOC_32735, partial [Thalassiosira oceanica]
LPANLECIADEVASLALEKAADEIASLAVEEATNEIASLAVEEASQTPDGATAGVGERDLESESSIEQNRKAHCEGIEIEYVAPSPPPVAPSPPPPPSRGARIKAIVGAISSPRLRLPKESSRAEGISLSLAPNAKKRHKSRPAASRRPAAENPLPSKHLRRENSPRSPEDSREDKDSGLLDPELAVESFNGLSGEYAARESREYNSAQSFADEITSLAVEEASLTDEFPCEWYESSGLSPRNADVDADVDDEKPMDSKSDSFHSNGYEPVIVSSSEFPVQLTISHNEEKSPLFIEIGHELVEIDLTKDEPTVPGRQVFVSPGTSKDEIDGSPNVGLSAVAEEEITEDETEMPSEEGYGGAPSAIAEETGLTSELPSDAEIADMKKSANVGFSAVAEGEITEDKTEMPSKGGEGGSPLSIVEGAKEAGKPSELSIDAEITDSKKRDDEGLLAGAPTAIAEETTKESGMPSELPSDTEIAEMKKRDLSKNFEVVGICTGQEKIRPSTRTKKYVALSTKYELEDEKDKEEKELREAARMDEERFAASQKARKEAEKEAEEAELMSELSSEAEVADVKEKDLSKGFEVVLNRTGRQENIRPSTTKKHVALSTKYELELEEKERIKAEKAKKSREDADKKAEKIWRRAEKKEKEKEALREKEKKELREAARMDEERFAARQQKRNASDKGKKPKKMSQQRTSEENRPIADVEKAPSHRRFKSQLRPKKYTAGDEAEEGERGTPSSGKAKSPKKQGTRWRFAGRKKNSEASKPDEPKSKTQSVSISSSGYIPLAERRYIPLAKPICSRSTNSHSRRSSDEEDVRDEYESSRRSLKGCGSRQSFDRDRLEGAFSVSILDVIDSYACPGQPLIGDDETTHGGSYTIERSISSSSSSYIDGYDMSRTQSIPIA